jgi:sulfite oxidase
MTSILLGPIKPIDPATHTLRVQGKVERELELKLDDLKRYPRAEVVAVLQCAGNRRATMETRTGRGVEGIKWGMFEYLQVIARLS